MRRRIIKIICVSSISICVLATGIISSAQGADYENIEDTENEEVIAITESISEIYPICPELIQAIIFYESSNRRSIVSRWGDVGYMQVNPIWQKDRLKNLGITDLKDGYLNILAGTDLLCELFRKYEDTTLVLMAYNIGEDRAVELYERGEVSDYAKKIMDLSEKLERFHGK